MITFMFCRLNNTTFLFSLGKWNDKAVSRQRILLQWNCILISQILNAREHSRECLSRGILVEIGLVSYIFSNCCKGQKSGMQIFVSPSFSSDYFIIYSMLIQFDVWLKFVRHTNDIYSK